MVKSTDRELAVDRVWVVNGGFSLLHHVVDEKGQLKGLVSVSILAILRDPATAAVVGVETIRGRHPAGLPIMGPDGEITVDNQLFASVEAYGDWYKTHAQ